MCTLAPRAAAAPGFFGAAAFLDRRRGVVAALPPAASSSEEKTTGEPTRRGVRAAAEVPTAPAAPKRGRPFHDHDVVVVDPASSTSSSALRVRMDTELVNIQGLLKRAKLLPPRCSAPTVAEKKSAPPVVSPPAAKRMASPLKPATEAAAAAYVPAKQQRPVMQRAPTNNPIAPEVPNKQQPAEAPPAAKKQSAVQRAAAAKTTEVQKKRRPEEEKELARAAARAEFRQMLVEMEKSAMPDETIYPEELEALGIPFEFVVTRTWKQALKDHAAKKLELAAGVHMA